MHWPLRMKAQIASVVPRQLHPVQERELVGILENADDMRFEVALGGVTSTLAVAAAAKVEPALIIRDEAQLPAARLNRPVIEAGGFARPQLRPS